MIKIALEAVEHLRGSCEDIYQEYADYEDNDEFTRIVDEHIFRCVQCGWWWDISELNHHDGEFVCVECFPEED